MITRTIQAVLVGFIFCVLGMAAFVLLHGFLTLLVFLATGDTGHVFPLPLGAVVIMRAVGIVSLCVGVAASFAASSGKHRE